MSHVVFHSGYVAKRGVFIDIAGSIKKIFFVCNCILLCLACWIWLSPNPRSEASEPIRIQVENTPDIDEMYDIFMRQSKQELIESLSSLSQDESDVESLLIAGQVLFKHTDFTCKDYLMMIRNPNNTVPLRSVAIECYAKKLSDSEVDKDIVALIADSDVDSSLRVLAVALLHHHFDAQEEAHISALLSAADSENDDLAYNAMKALEHIDPECAMIRAKDIYENFQNESPARINIACKILARYYSSDRFHNINQDEVHAFVQKSLEIYDLVNQEEVRSAVSQALALLPDSYSKNMEWHA